MNHPITVPELVIAVLIALFMAAGLALAVVMFA